MVTLRVNGLRFEAVGAPDQGLRLLPNIQVDDKPTGSAPFFALDVVVTVSIGGLVLPSRWDDSVRTGEDMQQWGSRELKLFVPLSRETIGRIEGVRQHNVTVSLNPTLRYFAQQGPPQSAYPSGQTQLLIPEDEWLEALEKMGYHGGWVIEVERPFVEGWSRPVEFLDKAWDRIQVRDAEGAIGQCRAAWESLGPLLEAAAEGIATEIDRGSAVEAGEPKKSERVLALRKSALKWAHAGAHPESYSASMEDALLAYRLTASLISFLSKKAVSAEAHSVSSSKKG
jgi:hypothetical protein